MIMIINTIDLVDCILIYYTITCSCT